MRSVRSAFYAALVLLAGATAAVLSHVTIDVAGDFLLSHDTYDGVAHHSRAFFVGIVVAVAAIVALRFLWEMLDRRSGSLVTLVRHLQAARGASPWRFFALVAAAAVVGLMAMELIDCLISSTPVDGVDDLLGGSVLLGLGTTVVLAAIVSSIVRLVLGFVAGWQPVIAAFIERLAANRPDPFATHFARESSLTLSLDGACRLSRRSGKRAPPISTPA